MWWPTVPRPRFSRKNADSGIDAASWFDIGDIADGLAVFAVIAMIVTFFVLLFTVVFPLVVLGIELVVFLLLALLGLAGRLLLGHPWTVRAQGRGGRELTWRVKGFGASGRVRDEAAQALANGDRDPRLT